MPQHPTYRIHAIRYAHHERRASENFIGGDPHDGPMPIDYFVWAIVGENRTFVVDTGFDAGMAAQRGRTITRPVAEGLRAIGVEAEKVEDVIVTHMHYDHAGNRALFPRARYHVQDREMAYCTGRCMCHHAMRHSFEPADVGAMVERLFAGRLRFHDGEDEIAPGISVHLIGGHTMGLQAVRVATERGPVVLASDGCHFYANMEQGRPFPIVYNVGDMMEGFGTLRRLAGADQRIVPGHDPLVLQRFPQSSPDHRDIVRVDLDPLV